MTLQLLKVSVLPQTTGFYSPFLHIYLCILVKKRKPALRRKIGKPLPRRPLKKKNVLFVCDYGTIASPLSKITMGSILSKKGVLQNFKLNSAATVNIADLKRKLKAADLVVPIYSHNQKVMSGVLKDLKIKREVLTLDPKDVLVNEAVFNKVLINLLKKKKTS